MQDVPLPAFDLPNLTRRSRDCIIRWVDFFQRVTWKTSRATFPVRFAVNSKHTPRSFSERPRLLSIIVVRCTTAKIRHGETYCKLVPQY